MKFCRRLKSPKTAVRKVSLSENAASASPEERRTARLVRETMREDPPTVPPTPPSASWIPIGIFLLVMLFTPLGRVWPLVVVIVGGLIYAKRLRLETGLLWAAVAFAGGVLSAGAWSPTTLAPSFREEGADEQPLPSNFKRLEVRGFDGFVRVNARVGLHRVRLERKGGATVTIEQRGDTVILTARKPFFSFSSGVNFTLDAPVGLEALVQTSNGFVEWQGTAARLELKTSNDRVTVRDAGTVTARLETSNDDIGLERVSGSVVARTSNGAIRAAEGTLSLDAQTDNASINLERLTLTNNTRSRAATSNGQVNVLGLSAASGLTVRGSTTNARLDVIAPGFDVRLEDTRFSAVRSGFGMAELEITTSNDRITLKP